MKKIVGIFVSTLLFTTVILPISTSLEIKSRETYRATNEQIIEDNLDFIPGVVFVKFREGTTLSFSFSNGIMTTGIPSIDNLNREFRVQNIKETFLSMFKKPKNPELFESIGLDRIYTFFVDEKIDILTAIKAYDSNPYVEYAEPDGIDYNCITPNDPIFPNQWGLHNDGTYPPGSPGKVDADIDALEAWDIERGDSSIVIAIIDSGIDWLHDDLKDRIWTNPNDFWSTGDDNTSGNGFDDDGNGFVDDYKGWDFYHNENNPMDKYGHGTFCAGIAGASTNNSIGIAGVDWNCRLMALKAGTGGSINRACSAEAILYAAENGAHVISMSFGGYTLYQPRKDAVDYAYGIGCVIVASTGNHGYNYIKYPARLDNVISVGMTNQNDVLDPYSNHGPDLDVVAPGRWIWSTLPNNDYDYGNGTSYSTPMVAGLAALLLSRDPSLTNSQVRKVIRKNAEDQVGDSKDTPGRDDYYGYGRINAYRAITNARDRADAKNIWSEFEVTMTKNKPSNYNHNLLDWFLERFPNLFPILKQLIIRLG